MGYPPLVQYETEEEYREHYECVYCRGPITTFDGFQVRFRKRDFHHHFRESSHRDGTKDRFSGPRAQRIDWIAAALRDPDSERYVGWDRKRKRYDHSRRVSIVMGDYVVVIALTKGWHAEFITAYVADTEAQRGPLSTLDKIRRGPKWEPQK